MADPSDFVSYSQLLGLTADDVARARERAQAEYDTATGEASSALAKSGQEARNRSYNSAAAVSVSQTGSYSDYLAARDRAAAAYSRLHQGRGGRGLDAVLDRAGADGAEDQGVDWSARESALNAESGRRWQLGQDIDKSNAENAARRKAEEEARAAMNASAQRARLESIASRLRNAASNVHRNTGTFHPFDTNNRFMFWSGHSPGYNPSDPKSGFGVESFTGGMSADEIDRLKKEYARLGGGDPNTLFNYDQAGHFEFGKWIPDKR